MPVWLWWVFAYCQQQNMYKRQSKTLKVWTFIEHLHILKLQLHVALCKWWINSTKLVENKSKNIVYGVQTVRIFLSAILICYAIFFIIIFFYNIEYFITLDKYLHFVQMQPIFQKRIQYERTISYSNLCGIITHHCRIRCRCRTHSRKCYPSAFAAFIPRGEMLSKRELQFQTMLLHEHIDIFQHR